MVVRLDSEAVAGDDAHLLGPLNGVEPSSRLPEPLEPYSHPAKKRTSADFQDCREEVETHDSSQAVNLSASSGTSSNFSSSSVRVETKLQEKQARRRQSDAREAL